MIIGCLAGISLYAQFSTPVRPDCGKYSTIQFSDGTFSCERYATFPWFAAGQNWQSQVSLFVPPLDPVNGRARGAAITTGIGPGANASYLFGGAAGNYAVIRGSDAQILPSSNSVRLDLVDSVACANGNCAPDGNLAVGPLWASIDAPDVQTLEATNMQLIFLSADAGGVYSRQVAVPPVFSDKSSGRWVSSFSETPTDQEAGSNASFMSFAVTNVSTVAQTVTVSLYDQSGKLIVEKDTPMLPAGISGDVFLGNGQFANQVIPGAVFPAVFKDFFALTRAQLSTEAAEAALRSGSIDGTLVFRSSAGQPIAPLVVRTVGASVTLLLQTPLP